jgi:hypothetical protein
MQNCNDLNWDEYTDKFGLIQPMPDTTSGNGLRFTATAILSGKHPDPKKLFVAILNCEQQPGLMQRFPGCLEQETGPDDYIPVLAASHRMDGGALAKRIYAYGLKHCGFYLNGSWNWQHPFDALLWRFPAFLPFARFCAYDSSGWAGQSLLAGAISDAAKSDKQDSKALSWHIIHEMRGKYLKTDKEITKWLIALEDQFGEDGMGQVHSLYFDPAHGNHPLSKALKGVFD